MIWWLRKYDYECPFLRALSNAQGQALGGLGLVVLGAGRVVGRRCMPECMTEPEK